MAKKLNSIADQTFLRYGLEMNAVVKKSIRILVWSLLGVTSVAAWWFLPGRHAEVNLSSKSAEAVSRFAFADEPIFLQVDPRWADERIGSGEPLRFVGCTLCCLSMALSHHGIALTPAELNQKLKANNGYTFRGWIKWDTLKRITDGRVEVVLPKNPSHRDINAALDRGDPVLVKVILRSGAQHWVLLVGRDQNDYLMKDPLGDGKHLEPLATLESNILAVRIVRKT